MNAEDFSPENAWAHLDSRIEDVGPRQPPSSLLTGEQLHNHFHSLAAEIALVDKCFCHSENLEAEVDIKEADHFDGHSWRLLPNETVEVQT